MLDTDTVISILKAHKLAVTDELADSITAHLNNQIEQMDDDKPPGLDEVALAAMQGILAADPSTDNIGAAAGQAWTVVVPSWIAAREQFIRMMTGSSTPSP